MPTIELTIDDVAEASRLAEISSAKWKDKYGHYGNQFKKHFVGKLGELAVEKYLLSKGESVRSYFRDSQQDKLCDIEIETEMSSQRIEVKTWSDLHWSVLGRCVAVSQFKWMQNKADKIIWCIAHHPPAITPEDVEERVVYVDIVGFSTMADVALTTPRYTGPPIAKPVFNFQVEKDDIRSL